MPYDFNWQDDQHSIIRVDIHGKVSWDEWYGIIEKIKTAVEQATHRIDVIFNDKVGMPAGNPMPHLRATTEKLRGLSHMGSIITVAPPHLSIIIKTIIGIVMRMSSLMGAGLPGAQFVKTIDEALVIIEHERARSQPTA